MFVCACLLDGLLASLFACVVGWLFVGCLLICFVVSLIGSLFGCLCVC